MTMNDFDRLDQALTDPESQEQLKAAESVFDTLLDIIRRGIRAELAGDFDGFLDTGMEAARLTVGLDRDQILVVLLGAMTIIAQGAEGVTD